jgi:hypothetical protein
MSMNVRVERTLIISVFQPVWHDEEYVPDTPVDIKDNYLHINIMCSIFSRFIIDITGLGLGVITIMPNAMMSASGSPEATCAGMLGIGASALFITGGLLGAVTNRPQFLLLGVGLQVSAFTLPIVIY